MREPKVTVIVLNYQGHTWLEACLSSVLDTSYSNFETILVDNASQDSSADFVRSRFPSIKVIENQSNTGFAEGNNIGMKVALASNAEYITLLNPDTKVTRDWLTELVAIGERESRVGIIGAVQLEYDGEALNSWTTSAFPRLVEELESPAQARPWIAVEWVEGACLAIKRKVLEEVGLLDPIYFAFYEEIDLCRRAALRGWQVALVPRSRIHHFRGGSWTADPVISRERDYRCDRSQFIYTLTEPRRTLVGNFGWYLVTLGTKGKDLLRSFSMRRAWDLFRMQFDVLSNSGALVTKWRRDRKGSA